MTPEKKIYIRRLLAITIMLLIVGVIYYLFNPAESGLFPPCPFHSITGLECPGCGSQRTFHYLLHFQLKDAFFTNPLLVIAIPYIITGIYVEYFGGKEKYPRVRKILYGKNAIVFVLIVIILFWIGRNLV